MILNRTGPMKGSSRAKMWPMQGSGRGEGGSQLVTDCYQSKMAAEDGRQRLTDVATAEAALDDLLVEDVVSSKARTYEYVRLSPG